MINTLIVDDTIAYRKILSQVSKNFSELKLVDTAINGIDAISKLEKHHVDLVFLDVFMPEMDGVETLKIIRKKYPNILVIMISGQTTRNADITIQALELGAIDFILKPSGNDSHKNLQELNKRFASILQLVKIKLKLQSITKPLPRIHPATKSTTLKTIAPKTYRLIAVGSSTGGPEALGKFISGLPFDLPVPLVIVQHMPPVFTKFLAESLNKKTKLNVVEAQEGMTLNPGHVFLAPGGKHMIIRKINEQHIIGLNNNPPENSCRPSVDVLFRSIASIYKASGILSVILTGMGQDGLKGVKTLKKHQCYSLTQSAKSCVVYGMPKAIEDENLSDESVDINIMSKRVTELIQGVKQR